MVFTRTKHGAKVLARQLNQSGVPAVEMHGNLSQGARTRNMEAFHAGRATTMVATDIAARGIHVDDVTLVVHADPPAEHKAYLHRSGRTARAGAAGTVITLMTDEQVRDVRALTRAAGIRPAHDPRRRRRHPVLARARAGRAHDWSPVGSGSPDAAGPLVGSRRGGGGRSRSAALARLRRWRSGRRRWRSRGARPAVLATARRPGPAGRQRGRCSGRRSSRRSRRRRGPGGGSGGGRSPQRRVVQLALALTRQPLVRPRGGGRDHPYGGLVPGHPVSLSKDTTRGHHMGLDDKAENKSDEAEGQGQGDRRPRDRQRVARGRGSRRPGRGEDEAGRREGQGRRRGRQGRLQALSPREVPGAGDFPLLGQHVPEERQLPGEPGTPRELASSPR